MHIEYLRTYDRCPRLDESARADDNRGENNDTTGNVEDDDNDDPPPHAEDDDNDDPPPRAEDDDEGAAFGENFSFPGLDAAIRAHLVENHIVAAPAPPISPNWRTLRRIRSLIARCDVLPSMKGIGSLCTRGVEEYLAELDGRVHNGVATRILCAASTWAYSDLKTFASMMCHRGLYGEFIGISVENDPTFIDTTAYLFLSDTLKLQILAFRGTEPTNLINWLSNANTHMVPQEDGSLHSGFLNAGIVVLPILKDLLLSEHNLARTLLEIQKNWCVPAAVFPDLKELRVHATDLEREKENRKKLETLETLETLENLKTPETLENLKNPETLKMIATITGENREKSGPALYICGHSLGGAYAAMAAAITQLDPTFEPIRERLRSVYTFGQPMVADRTFAETIDENLGVRIFRHRYKRVFGRICG